ncbi:hypothetical protein HanRHA438_Chr05g0216521 [Helianthus annuus]|nr:hypothetical protein HanHA300_Chr05g0169741 [Helianthus annuus]KAJ0584043.1 hypothetical protein HanHA89_Chr05g0183881 [Helianthus annuus]KAJ0749709.1 hypothetical protein HanLR1_Chr05g0173261 [Helianthus annuus]KAJ0918320.1 hypothetical protein HanRHA438_Chr05g0216521 [Helianthus annuus]
MRKTLRLLLRKQFRKPPVTDQTLFSAGRTQDNEPLMRALSKLIYVNSPDLRSCTFCRGSIGPTTISPILVV